MEGESSGVPAGWYPDPLGLPQLRWWDGAQWSEFTSEPAAPALSEPEPEPETTVGSDNVYSLDGVGASFEDPLADFLNGNIARSGATGVNPTIPPSEPTPVTPQPQPPAQPETPATPSLDFDFGGASGAPGGSAPTPPMPSTFDTMEAPHVIGYDDDGREFIAPVVPIVTTPGAAPVPPGGEPPRPPQPAAPAGIPVPPGPPGAGSQPVAPEPLIVAPQAADPFATATSTVYENADDESFGSRRARRHFERQREIEAPEPGFGAGVPASGPDAAAQFAAAQPPQPEPPYSGAVTAPVMIQRTAPGEPVAVPPFPGVPTPGAPVPGGGPAAPVPGSGPAAPVPGDGPAVPVPGGAAIPAPGAAVDSTGVSAQVAQPSTGALTPQPASAHANVAPGEPAPSATASKPTYSGASYLLAFLGVFPTAIIALMVVVLGLGKDQGLIWGVWGAAWLAGILLAFYDRLKLKLWGHANTASPFLAIFTPILYLVARNTATTGETGHGRKVLVYWVIAVVVMAGIVYVVPEVMESTIPGVTAPWTSPLHP